MKPPQHILPIIVFSQFCCTSLWFAGNGVMSDLIESFGLPLSALGHLTSAVQFGFIFGTLIFAVLTIADRFAPSKVFFGCALLGALFNLGIIWEGNQMSSILLFRFLTGFFLAGIYPVGMKIAADYYKEGLGKSLGFLVGALVVGTAFPHLAKEIIASFSWKWVMVFTAFLAVIGGLLMLIFIGNGPYRRYGKRIDFSAFLSVFKGLQFRKAAFGYFGHMWELYAFWAFVPVMLQTYSAHHPNVNFNIPLLSFLIIALGGLGCVLGGYLSHSLGTKKVATTALLLSALCCLVSPLFFIIPSETVFVGFLFFWGMVVIADSPLFSTMVAHNAPIALKGTALTIVNSIGFAVTIVSIQLLTILQPLAPPIFIYTVLAIGPILGLIVLRKEGKIAAA